MTDKKQIIEKHSPVIIANSVVFWQLQHGCAAKAASPTVACFHMHLAHARRLCAN